MWHVQHISYEMEGKASLECNVVKSIVPFMILSQFISLSRSGILNNSCNPMVAIEIKEKVCSVEAPLSCHLSLSYLLQILKYVSLFPMLLLHLDLLSLLIKCTYIQVLVWRNSSWKSPFLYWGLYSSLCLPPLSENLHHPVVLQLFLPGCKFCACGSVSVLLLLCCVFIV